MVISIVYLIIGIAVYFALLGKVNRLEEKKLLILHKAWGKLTIDIAYFVGCVVFWLPLFIKYQIQDYINEA